jgi:hypothetical protein
MATIAVVVAVGGGAYAAASGSLVGGDGTINGCVKRKGHALLVLKPGKKCPKRTTTLTFNQTGPRGEPGQNGVAGVAGAPATRYFESVQSDGKLGTGTATASARAQKGFYDVTFAGTDLSKCTAALTVGGNTSSFGFVSPGAAGAAWPGLANSGSSLTESPSTVAVRLYDALGETASVEAQDTAFQLAVFC